MLVHWQVCISSNLNNLYVKLPLELFDQILIEIQCTLHYIFNFTHHRSFLLTQKVKGVDNATSRFYLSDLRVVLIDEVFNFVFNLVTNVSLKLLLVKISVWGSNRQFQTFVIVCEMFSKLFIKARVADFDKFSKMLIVTNFGQGSCAVLA